MDTGFLLLGIEETPLLTSDPPVSTWLGWGDESLTRFKPPGHLLLTPRPLSPCPDHTASHPGFVPSARARFVRDRGRSTRGQTPRLYHEDKQSQQWRAGPGVGSHVGRRLFQRRLEGK